MPGSYAQDHCVVRLLLDPGPTSLDLELFFAERDQEERIDTGADARAIAAGGWSVLHAAFESAKTDPKTLDVLLEAGADPDAATRHGVTPLAMAAERGLDRSVRRLKSKTATSKPLQVLLAVDHARRELHDDIAALLESHADPLEAR